MTCQKLTGGGGGVGDFRLIIENDFTEMGSEIY